MTPNHHPSDGLLAAFAGGALATGHAIVVATHLENCAHCRAEVGIWEALGGHFVESLPSEEVAPAALARAMEFLDAPMPAEIRPSSSADTKTGRPRTLAGYAIGPRRWMTPTLWCASILKEPDGASTYLLGLKAGKSLPSHRHRGLETICVLEGAFDDGSLYGPGDFLEIEGERDHQPVVTPEANCVCVIASDGPPKLQGLLRWFARSLLGRA